MASRSKRSSKRLHGSQGGAGLQRARAKSQKKKLKKLAKSKEAYTIKLNTSLEDIAAMTHFSDENYMDMEPELLCRQVNDRAANGYALKLYSKDGEWIVGKIIRAFVTDAREVWGRVLPLEEPKKVTPLRDIW